MKGISFVETLKKIQKQLEKDKIKIKTDYFNIITLINK